MTESEAMRRTFGLALRGWGHVSPNPLVGAVLLRDASILGEGSHDAYGGTHAEIAALAGAGDARGATCVVNLEPCAHFGQNPPCVDALIKAGVTRVVYAIPDPDPKAGGGAARLRAAGISVEEGVLREEAAALNAPFLFSHQRPSRPFVALKVATSLDGFLADAWGKSQWVSGESAREHVHWLRAGFDAIAVGRNTAETDDPALTARGAVKPRVPPARVIFTRRGLISPDLKVVRTANEIPTILVADRKAEPRASADLGRYGVKVIGANTLAEALSGLRAAGIRSLFIEGGGILATNFLAGDLIDRIYWTQAPILLGGGTPAFGARGPTPLDQAASWTVTERRALGPDTLLVVDRALCLPAS